MNRELFTRLVICIFSFGFFLYSYIDKQNGMTQLRIEIPSLVKEIKTIQEENMRLQYEIDQFEHPAHLMQLARHSEFSHLKHPLMKDILTINEGMAIQLEDRPADVPHLSPKVALAVGAQD